MSIKVMSNVWEYSKQNGSKLLLLLAIADHAGDDGIAWPGIKKLAQKVRMSERHVSRMVNEIAEDGELIINHRYEDGQSNQYLVTVNLDDPDLILALTKRMKMTTEDACKMVKILRNGGGRQLVGGEGDDIAESDRQDIAESDRQDIAESTEPSLTVNEPSTLSPFGDRLSLMEGKADSRDETSLPDGKTQMLVLMGGRTNTDGNEAIADAESRLLRSGWNVRGQLVKDRLVYLLAATGWDVPTADSERKDWYKVLRDDHAKYHMPEVFDLYRQAHEKLSRRVLESDGDFTFPARPGALTRTMDGILEAKRIQQGGFNDLLPPSVRINSDGTKTFVVPSGTGEPPPPNTRPDPSGKGLTLIVT